jgi:NDP-sugar pyrophosphorylase family protein
LSSHRRHGRPCSILCARVDDARAFGRIEIGGDGVINGFAEKNLDLIGPGIVSAGVYLFGPEALAALDKTPGPSLEKDFFGSFAPGRAHGFVGDSVSFIDIGTPAGLTAASRYLSKGPGGSQ